MKEKIKNIKLLLLDVDGVMTDGSIHINDKGVESKAFNVRDGHGIKLLMRGGVNVGIITGRSSDVVSRRAKELGISIVRQGVKNKIEAYVDVLLGEGLRDEEVAYMGDDIVDLPVLKKAGFAIAVSDASEIILPHVDYVTKKSGGQGAVREVCELILMEQGLWSDLMKRYL